VVGNRSLLSPLIGFMWAFASGFLTIALKSSGLSTVVIHHANSVSRRCSFFQRRSIAARDGNLDL
jgi:hypothetical protein